MIFNGIPNANGVFYSKNNWGFVTNCYNECGYPKVIFHEKVITHNDYSVCAY